LEMAQKREFATKVRLGKRLPPSKRLPHGRGAFPRYYASRPQEDWRSPLYNVSGSGKS
jgi:hypothetical protein